MSVLRYEDADGNQHEVTHVYNVLLEDVHGILVHGGSHLDAEGCSHVLLRACTKVDNEGSMPP